MNAVIGTEKRGNNMDGIKKSKDIKKRLNRMAAFIGVAYLPFLVFLGARYDILNDSLSRIGWQLGGFRFLVTYILYTVPFMIFQFATFQIMSDRKTKLLKALILAGGMLIAVGALFPVKESSPRYSHFLHSLLCQIGSGLTIIAVTYMFVLFCKRNKQNVKAAAIIYAHLLIIVAAAYLLLHTAALFEAGASLLFLLAMHFMNSASYKDKGTRQIEKAKKANTAHLAPPMLQAS